MKNANIVSIGFVKEKPKKKRGLLSDLIKHYELLLILLPGLAAIIVFNYVPMYGVAIAFQNFKMIDGVFGSPWVGLDVFHRLFSGKDFINVLRNTLTISFLKLICGFPAPIILALLLNEVRSTGYKRIIQTFSYLPHFFSWVVLSGIITMIFSTEGPVNLLLKDFGATKSIPFFSDGTLFVMLLIVTTIWQSVGWGSIIYLASLSGIDESLYEAAIIDGAGRWKQTLYISIPSLVPTIATMFILNLGHILNGGFDQIYNLYNPTVYAVSDILDTFVLRRLQAMDYSLGTAVGLFKAVVGLALILSSNWFVRKLTDGEQGII